MGCQKCSVHIRTVAAFRMLCMMLRAFKFCEPLSAHLGMVICILCSSGHRRHLLQHLTICRQTTKHLVVHLSSHGSSTCSPRRFCTFLRYPLIAVWRCFCSGISPLRSKPCRPSSKSNPRHATCSTVVCCRWHGTLIPASLH